MPECDYVVQIGIVHACIALHNFVVKHLGEDAIYLDWDEDVRVTQQGPTRYRATRRRDGTVEVYSDAEKLTTDLSKEQKLRAADMRERIAQRMWKAYCRQPEEARLAERVSIARNGRRYI